MIQCIHCVWDPPFLCEISLGSMGLSLINAASFALLSPWSHIVSDFTIIQPFLTIWLDLKQCMITWLLNFKIVKPRANIRPDLITLIHEGLFIYKNSQFFFFLRKSSSPKVVLEAKFLNRHIWWIIKKFMQNLKRLEF